MEKVKRVLLKYSKKISYAEIVLFVSLFSVGLFHEYLSCVVSVLMLVWLTVKLIKKKLVRIYFNVIGLAVACLVLFYGFSIFGAIDRGMAFLGFLKFLPFVLYLVVLMQEEKTDDIIKKLPYIAVAMTLVSAIGMQIPQWKVFFSVSGRLAGFFQYPNTFC